MLIRIGMISAAPATLGAPYRTLVLSGRRSGGGAGGAVATAPLLAAMLTLGDGWVDSTGVGSFNVTNASTVERVGKFLTARLNAPRPPEGRARRLAARPAHQHAVDG